jgi:DNA repair protein RecN (Recombination protein N)
MGTAIGKKMKQISGKHQVICITHLPQLASFADKHFKTEKIIINDTTSVSIISLDEDTKRIEELAHMLGSGSDEDETAISQVKVMLERARNE